MTRRSLVALVLPLALAAKPPETTVIVTVTDIAGKPAKGVHVRVFSGVAHPDRSVSDASGEARFTTDPGPLQLSVDEPGQPVVLGTVEVAKPTERLSLQLVPPIPLAATIVDVRGAPVAGATVRIDPGHVDVVPPETKTDAKGRFQVLLTDGDWPMRVTLDGKADLLATVRITPGQTAVTAALTMLDAPSLIVDTDCALQRCRGASVDVSTPSTGMSRDLGPDGNVVLTNLNMSGDASVTVRDDSDPRHPLAGQAQVSLVAGQQARVMIHMVKLDAAFSISGTLVDDAGKRATIAQGGQLVVDVMFDGFSRRTIAQPDGSFTVPDLVAGPVELTGLRVDPNDPMSGANGGRQTTRAVAPTANVQVLVNDFFH